MHQPKGTELLNNVGHFLPNLPIRDHARIVTLLCLVDPLNKLLLLIPNRVQHSRQLLQCLLNVHFAIFSLFFFIFMCEAW